MDQWRDTSYMLKIYKQSKSYFSAEIKKNTILINLIQESETIAKKLVQYQ